MKRNVVLFGASVAVGVAASAGLIAGGTASSAATNAFAGYAYHGMLDSSGWSSGSFTIDSGFAVGSATAGTDSATGSVTFVGARKAGVTTTCNADGSVAVKVTGPAAGTYQAGAHLSLAKFSGEANAIGTVTFGKTVIGGYTVGAYIDYSQPGTEGSYVALTGAKCAASTTPPPTSTPPTSTSTPTGTSTSTSTSTPTSTATSTPTGSPTSSPTGTPTVEPPTPTPTTTTLPVTG